MSYPASIEKALAYLQTIELPEAYRKHPWFYRLLWKKGIALPPVLLAGFFTALAIFLLMERDTWVLPYDFLFRWATFGIASGFGIAFSIRSTQKKVKLRSWRGVQNLPIKTDAPDV